MHILESGAFKRIKDIWFFKSLIEAMFGPSVWPNAMGLTLTGVYVVLAWIAEFPLAAIILGAIIAFPFAVVGSDQLLSRIRGGRKKPAVDQSAEQVDPRTICVPYEGVLWCYAGSDRNPATGWPIAIAHCPVHPSIRLLYKPESRASPARQLAADDYIASGHGYLYCPKGDHTVTFSRPERVGAMKTLAEPILEGRLRDRVHEGGFVHSIAPETKVGLERLIKPTSEHNMVVHFMARCTFANNTDHEIRIYDAVLVLKFLDGSEIGIPCRKREGSSAPWLPKFPLVLGPYTSPLENSWRIDFDGLAYIDQKYWQERLYAAIQFRAIGLAEPTILAPVEFDLNWAIL